MPDAAEIGGTLSAIHASPEFARAPVMRHLLAYLVDETLAGRGDRLKAYSVAVDALGRSADFDAQTDSYPRVQVGRLRRMLEAFYSTSPDVPLRIQIPLGAYRVHFESRETDAPPVASRLPIDGATASGHRTDRRWPIIAVGGVALAAILVLAGWSLLDGPVQPGPPDSNVGLPPSISIEVGDTASTSADRARVSDVMRQISTAFTRSAVAQVTFGAAAVGARYGLLLDLGTDGKSLSIRLIDRKTGQLDWADSVVLPADPQLLTTTMRPHISALIRPSGVIAAHQRIELREDFSPGYPCLLHYDVYFRERAADLRQGVNACIARTITLDPTHAEALSAASFLAVDPTDGPVSAEARGQGLAFARRAAAADPYSPAPLMAEARIAFMDRNCVRGRMLVDRAVNLDGYDPETLGLAGLTLVSCDRTRAIELLRTARVLDPELTTFYVSALVLLELDAGRATEAAMIAGAMRPPGAGMFRQYLVAQILGSIARGDDARARLQWEALLKRTPPPRDTVEAVLAHFYLAPDFRAIIAERMAEAGITSGFGVAATAPARDKAAQTTGATR